MLGAAAKAPPVAVIDERACIGCTLCIEACPVDAIVGAAKLMHTVITAECTGCRLCLPPCPVDCIAMIETGEIWSHEERVKRAEQYRLRHGARKARLLSSRQEPTLGRNKQATIERAMQRARQRLQQRRNRQS